MRGRLHRLRSKAPAESERAYGAVHANLPGPARRQPQPQRLPDSRESENSSALAPTRTRRITAGSWMQCSGRSRLSISSVFRPVGISPSSRHLSWAGTLSAYGSSLPSGALVGASAQATLPASPERRYALREGRCAISHLPEPRLLDAAHIVMDADEQLGQPVVSNGLPLTKVHHAPSMPTLSASTRITEFTSPIGCSTCMMARSSNSG
jgi:hypothetical protein